VIIILLLERSLEFGNDAYICFVDFKKAVDKVDWMKMIEILKRIRVVCSDRRLLNNMYMNQETVLRVNADLSESGEIRRGVRLGCLLSSLFFIIILYYVDIMIEEAMIQRMELKLVPLKGCSR